MRSIGCLFPQVASAPCHSLYVVEALTAGACAYPAGEGRCPGCPRTGRKVRDISIQRISDAQIPEVQLRKLHWVTTRLGLHLIIQCCIACSMVCDYSILDLIRVLIAELDYLLLLLGIGEFRIIQNPINDSIELLNLIAHISTGTHILYSKPGLSSVRRYNALSDVIQTLQYIYILVRVLLCELRCELLYVVCSKWDISPVLKFLRQGCPYKLFT